ncbi:HD domain-containing protein [Candidatus Micrarchaeota archaeon]|nr:HD domain-containing protein [Candidatus Micrarchaeota archaeon]
MITTNHKGPAHAPLLQTVLFRAFSRSEPALEGLTRRYVERKLKEEENGVGRGLRPLICSAVERLNEQKKWQYTRRHCAEVGVYSYIIASEAKRWGVPGAEELDPKLCLIGGILHDIGKTFLPLALVIKERGVETFFGKVFEGRQMTGVERRIMRYEHLHAGIRYVKLFGTGQRFNVLLDMVGLHHVMYDGQHSLVPSYPSRFNGRDLPLHVRIAKTADFLSAVCPRHYRRDQWIVSLHDAIAYAVTVAGRELDPICVSSFLTGVHNRTLTDVMEMLPHFKHPGGRMGISDQDLLCRYLLELKQDPEFLELVKSRDQARFWQYQKRADVYARSVGFPTIVGSLPLSINNKYAQA